MTKTAAISGEQDNSPTSHLSELNSHKDLSEILAQSKLSLSLEIILNPQSQARHRI